MPEQSKFENMDLFASLEAIMKQNTGFYQSDLDIDKEIIAKAAASPHREDKTLLWFCRPSGTHCFRERDVFLKDTAPHNTWRFYMEQTSDRVLAYAIELTGKERGKIKGNLYELDYSKHYERVKEKELPADTVKLIYEHGERVQEAGRYFDLMKLYLSLDSFGQKDVENLIKSEAQRCKEQNTLQDVSNMAVQITIKK